MNLVGYVLFFVVNFEVFGASQALGCGRQQGVVGRVVGGTQAKKNEWPWLVAFVKLPDEKYFCAGSLIGVKNIVSG